MSDSFPVGVTRNERGGSDVEPLTGQECPVCGFEHFWSIAGFTSDWMPKEASTLECPECGSEWELIARRVD